MTIRDLRVSLPRVGLPRGFLMFHQHLVPWIVARVRKKCFAHSHDRPAARPLLLDSTQYDLRHAAISMYFTIYSSTGLPLCRASHERTIKASGGERLPCLRRSWSWASRMVGLPGCIQDGLPHGRASGDVNVRFIIGSPALSGLP